MTTFLLVVSLLLNGVAIFAIIILFTRQNRLSEVEKRQEKWIKDVEEIISSSLFEMKEENEAFIHRFQKISSQFPTSIISSKMREVDIKNNPSEGDLLKSEMMKKTGKALKKQAVKAYENFSSKQAVNIPLSDVDVIPSEQSIEDEKTEIPDTKVASKSEMSQEEIYRDLFVNQVHILQKQGFSSEDIAKKLGKGKTEIELLLKFSRNNQ
jgi:hypothetical protein